MRFPLPAALVRQGPSWRWRLTAGATEVLEAGRDYTRRAAKTGLRLPSFTGVCLLSLIDLGRTLATANSRRRSPSLTVVSGESLSDFGSVFSTWTVMRVLPDQVGIAMKERGATPTRNRRRHAVDTNGPSPTAFRCLPASALARAAIGGPELGQPDLAT